VSSQPPPDPSPYRPPGSYGPPEPDGTQPPAAEPPGRPSVPFPTDPTAAPASGGPAAPGPGTPVGGPAQPAYAPGYAAPRPPGPEFEPYPPTSYLPPVSGGGYPPPEAPLEQGGYGPPPGYGPGYQPGPPPRKSNAPLIAVIIAVSLLLCGGVATAGVLAVRNVTNKAKEAVKPITDPTLPALPTDAPNLPTEVPTLPTDLPGLPTDLPGLPTDLPGLPGVGKDVSVTYEVTGKGRANVVYTEDLSEGPKQASNVKLPWKFSAKLTDALLVSVTAVRTGQDDGKIKCRAKVDGKEVVTKTAAGPYAAVSCSKMVVG